MGNTADLPFIVDGNALNSTKSFNYESQSSWNTTVRSRDSGDPTLSFVKTLQISVVGKLDQLSNRQEFLLLLEQTLILIKDLDDFWHSFSFPWRLLSNLQPGYERFCIKTMK